MKLSIIVPVYNAEKYLRPCLDSLIDQKLDDYEIIAINDGSRDSSESILKEYEVRYPDRFRFLTVENGGQGRARNLGLSLARGEYLGFVDSDDIVERDMYKKLLTAAEQEGASLAVCDFRNFYEDGREELCVRWDADNPVFAAGSCCNKLFRRDAVEDIRYPEGLWYEDFSFSAKALLKAGKIAYVPEALYHYRCRESSTMNNNNAAKNLDILRVMEDLEIFTRAIGRREDFACMLINHVLLDAINRVARQDAADKEAVIGSLRAYVRRCIPRLFACESFRRESRNRRIVMALNYYGLHRLSHRLLQLK